MIDSFLKRAKRNRTFISKAYKYYSIIFSHTLGMVPLTREDPPKISFGNDGVFAKQNGNPTKLRMFQKQYDNII